MAFGIFYSETTKVVAVKNVPLGILRIMINIALFSFVVIYQYWYARGYQTFGEAETSITTKIKGFSS